MVAIPSVNQVVLICHRTGYTEEEALVAIPSVNQVVLISAPAGYLRKLSSPRRNPFSESGRSHSFAESFSAAQTFPAVAIPSVNQVVLMSVIRG